MINKITFFLTLFLPTFLSSCGFMQNAVHSVDESSIKLSMTVSEDYYTFTTLVNNKRNKNKYGELINVEYRNHNGDERFVHSEVYNAHSFGETKFIITSLHEDIPTTIAVATFTKICA